MSRLERGISITLFTRGLLLLISVVGWETLARASGPECRGRGSDQ
jgi:hypothetical protein